ncbi:MAG TPA: hypothetical protein VN886_11115 [Acidimicrobiales bacterium]|jgi:hypothetical protein|nr:hypothetical protein [Acidimicrobiales bacterium]
MTDMANGETRPDSASPPTAAAVQQPAQTLQAWTVLAATGVLVLSKSDQEYAVYDQTQTYGRWPLTEDGYKYAVQTYHAYQQSSAHGMAYQATGYQDPDRLGLPTDPVIKSQTYASPMSYVGSTRRIVGWASKTAERSPTSAVLAWTLGVLALLFMWTFLLGWYFVVFFLFGIFVIPYRLMRRSQRKNLHVQKTTLATQQAMLQQMQQQQQQMMMRQQHPAPQTVIGGQILPPPPPPSAIPQPTSS